MTLATKLPEKCFKGMGGAYAALFTPYDAKVRRRLAPVRREFECVRNLAKIGILPGATRKGMTTGRDWLVVPLLFNGCCGFSGNSKAGLAEFGLDIDKEIGA